MKLSVSLQFLNVGQSVGLFERVISSSQETSTNTGQHKHRINVHIHMNIHASNRIRTYDPGIQASQDFIIIIIIIIIWFVRLLALRPLLAYCASLG
jgi:hypothetical protein